MIPHAYGCQCEECRAMFAAISAVGADGDYFFTDRELEHLAGGTEMRKPKHFCHIHKDVELICPSCRGAAGGNTTAERYSSKQLAAWGKKGGRPRLAKTKRPRKES